MQIQSTESIFLSANPVDKCYLFRLFCKPTRSSSRDTIRYHVTLWGHLGSRENWLPVKSEENSTLVSCKKVPILRCERCSGFGGDRFWNFCQKMCFRNGSKSDLYLEVQVFEDFKWELCHKPW